MKNAIITTLAICAFVGAIIPQTLTAQERQECNRWVHQASAGYAFTSADWQRAQCHAYGITLPDKASYIETLKREAPETLTAPLRSDFMDQYSFNAALARFHALGYCATEASDYQQ